ncbi:MAG: hypothetical protein K0Q79_3716 [Flavipsychrobacter sp.]|jgi:hypothetical protein|nr:hypothetical protein [Flavipsychrobacter sp.]
MKKLFILLVLIFVSVISHAQSKVPAKTASTSEIDNLYKKYKDSKTVVLYTPLGDLDGNVSIEMNSNEKPVSVSISGETSSLDALVEFLYNTMLMKKKQGYRPTKNTFTNDIEKISIEATTNNENEFTSKTEMVRGISGYAGYYGNNSTTCVFLMKKGSLYFKMEVYSGNTYSWSIETGDTKRQGGKGATDFEF